jgi:hypothetical protein
MTDIRNRPSAPPRPSYGSPEVGRSLSLAEPVTVAVQWLCSEPTRSRQRVPIDLRATGNSRCQILLSPPPIRLRWILPAPTKFATSNSMPDVLLLIDPRSMEETVLALPYAVSMLWEDRSSGVDQSCLLLVHFLLPCLLRCALIHTRCLCCSVTVSSEQLLFRW